MNSTQSVCTERLDATDMAAVLSRAIDQGVIGHYDDTTVFYDLSRLDSILATLRASFPPTTLHAVAVKANPIVEILRRIRKAGHGAEVASIGELHLALAAGFPTETIIFDSPAKTREELELALKLGVRINANSLQELTRIASLYCTLASSSRVGLRINPEVGKGSINTTSVAVHNSKFGVSLPECRTALARAFSNYEWLTGVHVHIGSQGMALEQLVEGTAAVYDFVTGLQKDTGGIAFNIGGGLPAAYKESDQPYGFGEYAKALGHRCPGLFKQDASLTTEFGRSVHANCGWVATKVEYVVKHHDELSTIFVHAGADMFLRKVYRPDEWHHDISICCSDGSLRYGREAEFSVAGPLCFAGDYLDRSVTLPASVTEGDFVLIHDAGAYTFSMWSMYNSRQFPAIIGYEDVGKAFTSLRKRQTAEEVVEFWSEGTHK
ncbi:MAG: type III PLP-dependent enzyme domain-containing protein [Armatimonadota bacterium]